MLVFFIPLVNAETIVKGVVVDSLDNLVEGAKIKTDCLEGRNFETDKYGSFLIRNVPGENCRIYATFADGVGFADITVENQIYTPKIKLDKTIVNLSAGKKNYTFILFLAIVLVIALIFIGLFLKLSGKKEKEQKGAEENKQKEIKKECIEKIKETKSGRVKDILKILNSNEKKVVGFLLENNNQSSQARIRYNTGIPRTSLARCLRGLEAKKIVSVEKLGKMVKVKLTGWLLEK